MGPVHHVECGLQVMVGREGGKTVSCKVECPQGEGLMGTHTLVNLLESRTLEPCTYRDWGFLALLPTVSRTHWCVSQKARLLICESGGCFFAGAETLRPCPGHPLSDAGVLGTSLAV